MIRTFVLLLVLLSPAHAQQSTLYGADGRVIGRSVTDSQGTVTHYDAVGRRIGSTTTSPTTGTVTVYGADGRRIGTGSNRSGASERNDNFCCTRTN